jgi:hypothetical protein
VAWLGARGSGTTDRATAVGQVSRAMVLLGFSATLATAYLDRCFLAYGRLRSGSSIGPKMACLILLAAKVEEAQLWCSPSQQLT